MRVTRNTRRLAAIALALTAALAATTSAKVKVKTQHDKTFDFARVRTYAWHPTGAGEVKLLQSSGDDPAQIQARLDPIIRSTVEAQLAQRGLTRAASGEPDLYVYYYVLIGPNTSSQYAGQFIGSAPQWGLPPFAGATTSLKIYEQGSLVLDLSSPALKSAVWRGTAQAEVDRTLDPQKREQRLRAAITDMLKQFPPRK